MTEIKNALTVDVEDWFCVHNLSRVIAKDDWERCEFRLDKNLGRLLDLFDRAGQKATFFVLGWVAERIPSLIRDIEQAGHEIASHGYFHLLLTEAGPEEFEADLKRSIAVLARCTSQKPIGFRAPSFSITKNTLWAFDILERNGFLYDSSIVPTSYHPDYGMDTDTLAPFRLRSNFFEVPPTSASIFGLHLPTGGGYFRLYPYPLSRYLLNRCAKEGRSLVFYFHPWEIDPDQPRVRLPWARKFRHYLNLGKMFDRLESLLKDFKFTSVRDVLGL
jgi:polysaccharide deacetylase family protein (PEP-CTERM system associated)